VLSGTEDFSQDWTLDGVGNMSAVTTNGEEQDRTQNTSNEITGMTTGGTTTNPTYAAAGNLTSDGTLDYKYDAWNRLVKVDDASGVVATYAYFYNIILLLEVFRF
jgi:uncharacterized protein RhaS with RHS repeats